MYRTSEDTVTAARQECGRWSHLRRRTPARVELYVAG